MEDIMRIANNTSALSAFNILSKSNSPFQKTLQQLSSGLRINSAADDAAGLAISEKMRSQIGGLDKAITNAQDGISLLQTAEGGLEATTSLLQRMRELSVQAANDVLTQQDRSYIQTELDQLKQEVDRVAKTTQFNKKKILNGEASALWSSDSPQIKLRINGPVTGYEGKYKLDIQGKGGHAQVQEGRIFASGHEVEDTITETIEETVTRRIWIPVEDDEDTAELVRININTGRDDDGNTSGKGWRFDPYTGRLMITGYNKFHIYGTGEVTRNHIYVNKGVKADVFIENVQIDTDNNSFYLTDAAFLMDDANVNLYLIGNNYLHSGYHRSALEAPQGSVLTINSAAGDGETDGTLNAYGGTHGSGIGGCCCAFFNIPESAGGNIVIRGGTINARGGDYGAGIGGGQKRDAGTIEIYGGVVNAYGGSYSAGIGSSDRIGDSGSATVIIGGGKVYAEGKLGGAGIGGGAYSGAGTIKIAAGLVENGDVVAKGSSLTSYYYGYAPGKNGSATAGDDIGAGIGYIGDYTGYEGDAAITIPPQPVLNEIEKIITKTVEITTDEEVEEEVTLSEDIALSHTSIEKSTLGDFLSSSTTTTTSTSTSSSSGSDFVGSEVDATFMSTGSEKLRLIQGDGKTAEITLYSGDTMEDIAAKINAAIADQLGQRQYVDDATHFCTLEDMPGHAQTVYTTGYRRDDDGQLVLDADGNPVETDPAVSGTTTLQKLVVRSGIAGRDGEIEFDGSEELLKFLGFSEVEKSRECEYLINISDAHSGKTYSLAQKITGSTAYGLFGGSVDINWEGMSGLEGTWRDSPLGGRYETLSTGTFSSVVHLADNALTLQVGANEGEDFVLRIGDMSADALGVDRVDVMSHDRAGRSITIIDNALDKVSTQRALIGANENALEHTMNRLIIASENLTQAESRIRDADIAKVMMMFTRINIMRQANMSMLAQANQLPQNVLSLIR